MSPERAVAPALLADIGGTNARFALGRAGEVGAITTLKTADHRDIGSAIRTFFETAGLDAPPQMAALACAGPVEGGLVQMTNLEWRIDAEQIRDEIGIEKVQLVNDFASVAWAIPFLEAADLHQIGGGEAVPGGPAVVLGPGTGLGVAGYLPYGSGEAIVVGEGGHVSMPAITDREADVLAVARDELDHVSAERLLSGEGIERLYAILARLDGVEVPERTAAEITGAAIAQDCPICREAFDMFCDMLGTIASNLAVTFGARGGVYIAGGIAPKNLDYFAASGFRRRFEAKGRFSGYLARIPTSIVMHPEPAFLGLMHVLRANAA